MAETYNPNLLTYLGLGLLRSSLPGPRQNLGANLLDSLGQYGQAKSSYAQDQRLQQTANQQQQLMGAKIAEEERQRQAMGRIQGLLSEPADMVSLSSAGTPEARRQQALMEYATNIDPKALGGLLTPERMKASDFLHGNAGDRFVNPNTGQVFDIPANPNDPSMKPYYSPFSTESGAMTFDHRTGFFSPAKTADGKPIIRPQDSPKLQGEIASAKKSGELTGQDTTQAKIDLPKITAQADYAISLVSRLKDHPGMEISVGKSSIVRPWIIPGTDAANFKTMLDQVDGKQFLEAYETLKGTGQITEIEGINAKKAIARMQTSQTEEEFRKSADEFIGIIQQARQRAIKKAGGAAPGTPLTEPAGQPKSPTAYIRTGTNSKGQRVGQRADGTIEVIK